MGKKVNTAGSLATCTEYLGSGITNLVTKSYTTGSKVSILIDVVAQDGDATSTNRTGTKNTYVVKFYDQDPGRTKNGDSITYSNTSATALATATGITLNNPLGNNDVHFSATKGQSKLGFYANVYASSKLKGTWEIPTASLYHEAEEIDE